VLTTPSSYMVFPFCLTTLGCQTAIQARVGSACGGFENAVTIGVGEFSVFDIAHRVIKEVPGIGVLGAHGTNHFGGEHNVVVRDHLEQCIDAGLVVNAGIEVNILQQVVFQVRFV